MTDPISRRRFIRIGLGAAAVAIPAGIVGYTIEIEPHWLEIVRATERKPS